jgi:hypothetical protein
MMDLWTAPVAFLSTQFSGVNKDSSSGGRSWTIGMAVVMVMRSAVASVERQVKEKYMMEVVVQGKEKEIDDTAGGDTQKEC